MIMRLHKRPALGIAALPTTRHNTIDEIVTESVQREEAGVETLSRIARSRERQIGGSRGICDPHDRCRSRAHSRDGAYANEARARLGPMPRDQSPLPFTRSP